MKHIVLCLLSACHQNPFLSPFPGSRLPLVNANQTSSPVLRKIPAPYDALFAITSDADHAVSLSAYLEWQKYLNTSGDTVYGPGLGLEVGNSFWFYNGVGDDQLSYFQGTSGRESAFAGPCRELWRSGHIDTLHSYGDFNRGGFSRALAETAVNELDRQRFSPRVWVNHGNDANSQNIGTITPYQGADPDSKAYHQDLLRGLGTRFFWMGRTTHVAGQDAAFSLGNQLQQKLQNLVLKTKYRKIQRPLPDPPNRLLIQTALADGSRVLDFQRFISRFGKVKNTDFHDLGLQLSEGNLSALLKSQGFMLLYTHMNEHLPESGPLPVAVRTGFERLRKLQEQKRLLVTTTSRLLVYADLIQHLTWTMKTAGPVRQLHLQRDDHLPLTRETLQGVTFYVDEPQTVTLYFNDQPLPAQTNPAGSGQPTSIGVPWQPLVYPL